MTECTSTAPEPQQQPCGYAHCPNHGTSFCESVYQPRQENQRLRCFDDSEEEKKLIDAPVGICEVDSTKVDLPRLIWTGYETTPKTLTMRNTGKTVMINGQWGQGRPCLTGGPLNGTYIFSQIHFHCPSEHQVNGIRYPLEMHVVHYKTSYLTQEKAMYERDGTIVLVYLFQVADIGPTQFGHIANVAGCIDTENTSIELPKLALHYLVTPFATNYYLYWGSVNTDKNSYLIQWFVHRKISCMSRGEVNNIFKVMDTLKSPSGFTRMKPENGEVFYVEEDECYDQPPRQHVCASKHSESCKRSLSVHTCRSHISCRSMHFKSHHSSCCDRCSYRLCRQHSHQHCHHQEQQQQSTRHVTIQTADECVNTTPVSSRSNTSKYSGGRRSPKTSDKESDCDSIHSHDSCKAKKRSRSKSPKREKSPKCKKEKKTKDKQAKKACEKIAKTICKSSNSCKSLLKASADEVKKKERAVVEAVCEVVDDIKTIYENKQKGKKGDKKKADKKGKEKNRKECDDADEIQVNFLLTPNTLQSKFSNVLHSVKSTLSEIKKDLMADEKVSQNCLNVPTRTLLKRNSSSDHEETKSKDAKKEPKEFSLLMEHSFLSSANSNVAGIDNDCSWNFQKYQFAIGCDQGVLQEYNGVLQQDQLSLGNYEKLSLVPKFENPNDMQISLADCSVKRENSENIRISGKFLVRENALMSRMFHEKITQGLLNFLDVDTQCVEEGKGVESGPRKFSSPLNSDFEIEKYIKNQMVKLIDGRKSSISVKGFKEELKEDLLAKFQEKLRSKLEREIRDELLPDEGLSKVSSQENPRIHEDIVGGSNIEQVDVPSTDNFLKVATDDPMPLKGTETKLQLVQKEKSQTNFEDLPEKVGKESGKMLTILRMGNGKPKCFKINRKSVLKNGLKTGSSSPSNTSNCSTNTNKTTFFVYDKIEKDPATGRKIFVGSFKTKEEINYIRKVASSEYLEQISSDLSSNGKRNFEREQVPSADAQSILSHYSDVFGKDTWGETFLSESKWLTSTPEVSSLDKSPLTPLKNGQPKNFDDDVCSGLDPEIRSFLVGKIIGQVNDRLEKRSREKVAAVPGASKKASKHSFLCEDDGKSEKEGANRPFLPATKDLSGRKSKSINLESEDIVGKEVSEKKSESSQRSTRSRGTIIIIPIEVESLSKIELILVEHCDDMKDGGIDSKCVPCLKCHKSSGSPNRGTNLLSVPVREEGDLKMSFTKRSDPFNLRFQQRLPSTSETGFLFRETSLPPFKFHFLGFRVGQSPVYENSGEMEINVRAGVSVDWSILQSMTPFNLLVGAEKEIS